MSDDAEREADLVENDEAATGQAVACLAETARQLREMADYLHELAGRPLSGGPTLH